MDEMDEMDEMYKIQFLFSKFNLDDYENCNDIKLAIDKKFVDNIEKSKIQTKEWRKSQLWYINGKKNECEIYQRELCEKITNKKLNKTNLRINFEDNKLEEEKYPLKLINGFNYSEDFDGYIKINENHIYFNLKILLNLILLQMVLLYLIQMLVFLIHLKYTQN